MTPLPVFRFLFAVLKECFTCRFTDDEVSTLIHFELACIVGSVLLTEPLHLFTLCAGETCHAHSATTQYRAQIFLNRQFGVPEKAKERKGFRKQHNEDYSHSQLFNKYGLTVFTCLESFPSKL